MKKTYYLIFSLLLSLANSSILQGTQQTTPSTKPSIITTLATLCLASSLPKNSSYKKNSRGFTTIQPFYKNDEQYVYVLQSIDNQNICQSEMPLLFEKDWTLGKLASIPYNRQNHYIHIIADELNTPICYIGSIGLKGGGNASSTTNSSDSDYDSYSVPSSPINSSFTNFNRHCNLDRTFNDTNLFGDESCDNTTENYIDKTYQSSCLDKDRDHKNDKGMNTSSHSTPSTKTDFSLPKISDFWFDHQTKPLDPPSPKFITQSSSTISKQKTPPSQLTQNSLYMSTNNKTTSSDRISFFELFGSSKQTSKTDPLLSLLNLSKDKRSSNDVLSSWRDNNNTKNNHPCSQTKLSAPNLNGLFLNEQNEHQGLNKCFSNAIHITKDSKLELTPQQAYQKQGVDNELKTIDCKRENGPDELDDFVSKYLKNEEKQEKNNQKLCKLSMLRDEAEDLVKKTKQFLEKITSDNKEQHRDEAIERIKVLEEKRDLLKQNELDVLRINSDIRMSNPELSKWSSKVQKQIDNLYKVILRLDLCKLGNSAECCGLTTLSNFKRIGQEVKPQVQRGERRKKNRLRKTGELIGMECLF